MHAALGSFTLVREIIVSALEPKISTFKWQFVICAVLGHPSTSVALVFLHNMTYCVFHDNFHWDHSLCIPHCAFGPGANSLATYCIYGLHLFRCFCQWTA